MATEVKDEEAATTEEAATRVARARASHLERKLGRTAGGEASVVGATVLHSLHSPPVVTPGIREEKQHKVQQRAQREDGGVSQPPH